MKKDTASQIQDEKDWLEAIEELEENNQKIGGKYKEKINELKNSKKNNWDELKNLLAEMDKQPTLKEEIDYKDKYLRTLAELENTRKRMQKEKQGAIKFSIENSIGEFLPILDNFEKALQFAGKASEEVKNWASGFQMILSSMKEILHNHGIVAFHSVGNRFDPYYHEAVEIVETDEAEDSIIIEEFAKGYKSATRTIRPAQVKVAKKSSKKVEELKNNEKESKDEQEEQK
jgi:molecular chaperone GrpE